MLATANGYSQTLPHHDISIVLSPKLHTLTAKDRVTLPSGAARIQYFSLHRGLHPTSPDAKIRAVQETHANWLQQYRITLQPGRDGFTLDYGGDILQPPQQDGSDARNFENSPGIMETEGAVLTGDSGWYPLFDGVMLTFKLDVTLPQGWRAVSQGERLVDEQAHSVWQEMQPQDEIFLIASPFTEYAQTDSGIEDLVYLRKSDPPLAQRYLGATARYIAMYQRLIGPYPYAKFALVENFWETGYGMPSFTLLGSRVIRLPFIVDTSYPHEILHNWWGNGVYVDYRGGNWSEGLTAYLADHLLQEQSGNGAEYRRSTLQKYADFVSADRDFPLAQFTSRHSVQSEAVGYGKSMMLFHMLRRQLGDDTFTRALQNFYRNHLFQHASFNDLEQAFSQAAGPTAGKNLKLMFAQWVQRTGAPQLGLVSAETHRIGKGYELSIVVEQTQPGLAYDLNLPLAITLAGQDAAYSTVAEMKDKRMKILLPLTAQPLRVDVDPEFDLFRRLDRAEIPPAFSQIFGAEKLLIVLPRKAPEALRTQYRSIAETWQKQTARETVIKWDDEIKQLPDTGAVWLFGWENGFREEFNSALEKNAVLSDAGAQFGNGEYRRDQHALALAAHIGGTPAAWLAAPDAEMLTILARKLPHYAKFSYVAFSGAELTNLAKGMWPVTGSPLAKAVKQEDGSTLKVMRGKLPIRESLAK